MRKTRVVTIDWGAPCPPDRGPQPGENRDHGKRFLITEMSALKAERWATRAVLALTPRLSREVDPALAQQLEENPTMPPMGRIFALLSGVSFPELEPLLDELMSCVQIMEEHVTRPLGVGGAEDIEEGATIRILRQEVMALHTGFTMPASLLSLMEAASMIDLSPSDAPTYPPP